MSSNALCGLPALKSKRAPIGHCSAGDRNLRMLSAGVSNVELYQCSRCAMPGTALEKQIHIVYPVPGNAHSIHDGLLVGELPDPEVDGPAVRNGPTTGGGDVQPVEVRRAEVVRPLHRRARHVHADPATPAARGCPAAPRSGRGQHNRHGERDAEQLHGGAYTHRARPAHRAA